MIIAIAVRVTGQAWAKDAEGNLRPLAEGDRLTDGEVVVTETGARVILVDPDGTPLAQIGGEVEVAMSEAITQQGSADDEVIEDAEIARVLALLEEGDLLDALEAPAAGAAGAPASRAGMISSAFCVLSKRCHRCRLNTATSVRPTRSRSRMAGPRSMKTKALP